MNTGSKFKKAKEKKNKQSARPDPFCNQATLNQVFTNAAGAAAYDF
jgi:hypothetical protein